VTPHLNGGRHWLQPGVHLCERLHDRGHGVRWGQCDAAHRVQHAGKQGAKGKETPGPSRNDKQPVCTVRGACINLATDGSATTNQAQLFVNSTPVCMAVPKTRAAQGHFPSSASSRTAVAKQNKKRVDFATPSRSHLSVAAMILPASSSISGAVSLKFRAEMGAMAPDRRRMSNASVASAATARMAGVCTVVPSLPLPVANKTTPSRLSRHHQGHRRLYSSQRLACRLTGDRGDPSRPLLYWRLFGPCCSLRTGACDADRCEERGGRLWTSRSHVALPAPFRQPALSPLWAELPWEAPLVHARPPWSSCILPMSRSDWHDGMWPPLSPHPCDGAFVGSVW
jgi:hypothetical protein